jgi:acetyl esterase/lipase/peptidoglycan/xylan/chitin deacetylase (PgdA/CDA1 family)
LLAPFLISHAAGADNAVLHFTIGMHIEPLGVTAQGFGRPGGPNYRTPQLFSRHIEDILTVTRLVERHGGRMTIQFQSPFTSIAIEQQNPLLADLAARGHEIALHFHEDAHLGPNSSALPMETWCEVLRQEIELVRKAGGVERIRYWSGGNLYPELYKAAACAGLDVNSDWKDPRSQTTPAEILGVIPWRPAGGTDGTDLTLFSRHDPNGAIVFLPEGQYDSTNFASMRRAQDAGGDAAYFDYLKRMLLASVEAAQPDKVNVFHFTIHPGEFRGDLATPFAVIEQFLTDAVDPLVASGKVRWATFSEMADAFAAWERAHPGVDPRGFAAPPGQTPPVRGWITFAINAHDWTHAGESAETLARLVDLFERYQVRGDFYFTPELTRKLAAEHPELIERLRNSTMTISYHIRPPHPLYPGFDQRLRALDEDARWQTLLDYETYALDPATGELDRSQPGGYRYVAEVFGRPPVVASAPTTDPRLRNTAERLYAWLGAQMTVRYHEQGTKIHQPFEYVNDLLIRPSDFSITRVNLPGGQNFWWNLILTPEGDRYRPVRLLEQQLAAWEERKPGRPPLITALIHENNFARSGPEGWSSIYFTIVGGRLSEPLPPPWDLNAPDPSRPRSEEEKAAIWSAYEELVAYAARELSVVTSEDLVKLARTGWGDPPPPGGNASPALFDPAKVGTTERDLAYCGGGRLLMDVYYPRSAERRWPALVFVHGGGWTGGDKAAGGPEIPALRDAGFLVVSINYRLAPQFRFPAMIEDVKCAVRFLRAHAAAFHLDPDRIGAWGSSAGGHLAGLLGTADATAGFDVGPHLDNSSRVQAVAVLFGPADLTVPFPGGYEGRGHIFGSFDPALASPVTYVSADDPPFLLVHGDADSLVPLSQSEIFLDRLLRAGVSAQLIVVRNAQHGLTPVGGQTMSPARPEVTRLIVEFFQKQLGSE